MAKFVVARGGMLSDEHITADWVHIKDSGALAFGVYTGPVIGRPGRPTQMTQAFAPGRWVELLRLPDDSAG